MPLPRLPTGSKPDPVTVTVWMPAGNGPAGSTVTDGPDAETGLPIATSARTTAVRAEPVLRLELHRGDRKARIWVDLLLAGMDRWVDWAPATSLGTRRLPCRLISGSPEYTPAE